MVGPARGRSMYLLYAGEFDPEQLVVNVQGVTNISEMNKQNNQEM